MVLALHHPWAIGPKRATTWHERVSWDECFGHLPVRRSNSRLVLGGKGVSTLCLLEWTKGCYIWSGSGTVSSKDMVWSQVLSCRDNVRVGGCLVSPGKYQRPEGRFSINMSIYEMKLYVIRMTLSDTNRHPLSVGKLVLARSEARLIPVKFCHDERNGTIEWSRTKMREKICLAVNIP